MAKVILDKEDFDKLIFAAKNAGRYSKLKNCPHCGYPYIEGTTCAHCGSSNTIIEINGCISDYKPEDIKVEILEN